METLAQFIQHKRDDLGLSAKGLAMATNLPLETIEDIEYMKALGVNGVLIGETLIKNLNNEEFKEGLNNLLLCK